jgi:hypothetical protein
MAADLAGAAVGATERDVSCRHDPEIADSLAPDAVLLRACLHTLAWRGSGGYSASELAAALPAVLVSSGSEAQGHAPGA